MCQFFGYIIVFIVCWSNIENVRCFIIRYDHHGQIGFRSICLSICSFVSSRSVNIGHFRYSIITDLSFRWKNIKYQRTHFDYFKYWSFKICFDHRLFIEIRFDHLDWSIVNHQLLVSQWYRTSSFPNLIQIQIGYESSWFSKNKLIPLTLELNSTGEQFALLAKNSTQRKLFLFETLGGKILKIFDEHLDI